MSVAHSCLLDEEECFRAVVSRDPKADGTFVYAVKTTGIYCRPSCGSRQPKRTNVQFFPVPRDAQRAGFRACKKCQPDAVTKPIPAAILRAMELVHKAAKPLTLDELGTAVGLSGPHLQRLFRQHVGLSPKRYAIACREEQLHNELAEGKPILAAMNHVGISSTSQLYGASQRSGATPRERRKSSLLTIRIATSATSLGTIAIGATQRGICVIELASSALEARQLVRRRFPEATLTEADESMSDWIAQAVAAIDRGASADQLPLDVQGTAFQQQVWVELRKIPLGSTTTYQQVASAIGRPSASRAVGSACGKNPVAVVIPCHRVLPQSGEVLHYRWGTSRKAELLARETPL